MTARRKSFDDKTPSEPIRLKSGAALNLLDLATVASRLARAFDRAERGNDGATRLALGQELVKLGREYGAIGYGIIREGRKRQ